MSRYLFKLAIRLLSQFGWHRGRYTVPFLRGDGFFIFPMHLGLEEGDENDENFNR